MNKLDEEYTNKRTTLDEEEKQLREDFREELTSQREFLEDEFKIKKNNLDKTHEERIESINERQAELDEREKQLDDRDSKHARRQIRKDIKKIIEDRNQKFRLTSDTVRKRKPIHYITLTALTIVFSLFVYTTIVSTNSIGSLENASVLANLSLMIKPITFAIFLTTLIVFYIRWNNQWFQQHAKEEFRLKRFDLDVDRASWVVEMAMEWQEEKGKEIPIELIQKLTNNLFTEEGQKNVQLHPADKFVSSLFGSSSEASINVPGFGEFKLNKRGLKKLRDAELESD